MYRLDDKILTVDELMSLAENNDAEMIKSANQLYKNKYRLEFENQIGELLAQIYKSNEEGGTFDYIKIYSLLERLVKSDIRDLRDEIYNAIIPHLQQLGCIDNRHFKALLHLYDVVDFNSFTVQNFNVLDFLMSLLVKENLAMKLKHPIAQEEYDIVYDFLSNTTHPVFISSALSSFKDMVENDAITKDNLLMDLSVLSGIQLKYFENEQNKFSEDGFTLFSNCISKMDSLFFRTKVFGIMKKVIKENSEGYFRTFIGIGETSNPDFNTYILKYLVVLYLEVMMNLRSI